MVSNKSLIFNSVPKDFPVPGETLKQTTADLDLDASLEAGSIITKTVVLSLDPYQRGRMREPGTKSYVPPYDLGKPIVNFGVSKVVKSSNDKIKEGDHVYGSTPFSEYNVFDSKAASSLVTLENKEKLPWATWVGAAGMPGQTASYGLNQLGINPKKGETIFVSGASGAVGQMVISLSQRQGLKVIASAGTDEKVEYLRSELGVDVAFNYKTEKTRDVLSKNPFNIYWDNVGGETLEDVYATIEKEGRIISCGAIADYNTPEPYGIKNTFQTVAKELYVRGFIVLNHTVDNFYETIPADIASGKIRTPKEHVYKGLDNGEGFLDLMKGGNFGKAVISLE